MADVDFGPLNHLVGTWTGNKGSDVSPTLEGSEETPYFETIVVEEVGDVTNAGKQTLVVVKYHQQVSIKSSGEVFHDEIGYWYWDSATNVLAQSLTIPRAVAVLAGGEVTENNGSTQFSVKATYGDDDWGIVQSPFMRDNARTVEFRHNVEVKGNTMTYSETMVLDIYGKTFNHTDGNTLTKS